ncbi:AIPR family protein [Cellulosimicrobium sp. SL-1]|uniref:AIPR family protein n=1 Tax=Cellulosimicrobium sp. SL-1 TaxID=2699423 RepID=UPI0013D6DF8D|nr:AIPR family protein [Cellulosimicrobium sp. SL-1]
MANRIQLRQVERALLREYEKYLDLSDVKSASDEQRGKNLRTRSLAAEAVRLAAGVTHPEAADCVTDGTGDNGIDAVFVDEATSRITLVQSKWHASGSGTIGVGEAHAFIRGFKDLTDENFEAFNERVRRKSDAITNALNDTKLVIDMIIVTSGGDELAPEVSVLIDDLCAEMNHDSEMLVVNVWGVEYLRARLAAESVGTRVDLSGVPIEHWGMLSEPYQAYYGVVDGAVVKAWHDVHGEALFSQNIRKSLGATSVNASLGQTVSEDPEHFWYFNNGVTVLCDKVSKRARGATTRTIGEFDLEGASVVNGAQTVASIARALIDSPVDGMNPKVWVRVISLEGCPPDFANRVTRATNTQNSVESRDFVSLDDEQLRLRTDFRLSLDKTYSIKRGEPEPEPSSGCTVIEAAIALACLQRDVSLAVIAKSAPGRLWDMQGRYYRQLFNSGTTPHLVWRSVQTMRWVDSALDNAYSTLRDGRPRAVNAQGRRIVLWTVFRALDSGRLDDADFDWSEMQPRVMALADSAAAAMYEEVERMFPANYIASLFKNSSRCRALSEALVERIPF